MKELLWAAVDSCRARRARFTCCADIEDLSGDEVARQLEITLAAMKSRLHRARRVVREKLDRSLSASVGS